MNKHGLRMLGLALASLVILATIGVATETDASAVRPCDFSDLGMDVRLTPPPGAVFVESGLAATDVRGEVWENQGLAYDLPGWETYDLLHSKCACFAEIRVYKLGDHQSVTTIHPVSKMPMLVVTRERRSDKWGGTYPVDPGSWGSCAGCGEEVESLKVFLPVESIFIQAWKPAETGRGGNIRIHSSGANVGSVQFRIPYYPMDLYQLGGQWEIERIVLKFKVVDFVHPLKLSFSQAEVPFDPKATWASHSELFKRHGPEERFLVGNKGIFMVNLTHIVSFEPTAVNLLIYGLPVNNVSTGTVIGDLMVEVYFHPVT